MPLWLKIVFAVWIIAITMVPVMRLISRLGFEEDGDWLTLAYMVYALIVCGIFSYVVAYACGAVS